MTKEKSNKIEKKWKSYITGIITSNLMSNNKIDKYFRYPITESTSKAIQENWIRILGIDYEIISMNICKDNKPLGIALGGISESNKETGDIIQRHFLKSILPNFCIGLTHTFRVKDELLEVNGLKVYGLPTKDLIHSLKKLSNNFQMVVARSIHDKYESASDDGLEGSPISFYDMDEDESSNHGTLRSVTSNYSTTSRDFGSTVSVGGLIDGQYETVSEYLKNMVGWRGPLIIEFRKQKERFGLALEEIRDPRSSQLIIVFKIIAPKMIAGKDGRLHAGDRLLHVNGKPVLGIPFKKVCQWIKSTSSGRLVLCICKPHFEATNFDHTDHSNEDNNFYNTLRDADKLPKLSEETNREAVVIPPVPDNLQQNLVLKRVDEKLGIILDILDGGVNGARIKKITRGLVKDDGTLREGDFVRKINGISFVVDDKMKLDYCLRKLKENIVDDFNICYVTAEEVSLHKRNYLKQAPIHLIYPDPESIMAVGETSSDFTLMKTKPSKLAFVEFNLTIENDHKTRLGLIISPSLREPDRLVSICDIHADSLAEKCGSLKINDDILMVNDTSLENLSVQAAGKLLQKAMQTDDLLNFKVKRLTNSDEDGLDGIGVDMVLQRLVTLPDIYCCSIKKKSAGFGFSLRDSDNQMAVLVDRIDSTGSAVKVEKLKSGDRFVMVNKCEVINSPKAKVLQIIKNSSRSLQLIMERQKYQQLSVQITKNSSMSLGLNVGGGVDTNSPLPIIESFVPNRTSRFSEEIFVGDVILTVDGISMVDRNHDEVIQILRSTGPESMLVLIRQLPYIKRNLLDHYETCNFPTNYLQSNEYSVTLSKPVDTISTFGISLIDVVILDPNDKFKELARYKAVKSIATDSLAEKYAPEIKCFDYLISIDSVPIDSLLTNRDLKELIDMTSRVSLCLSRDVPYVFEQSSKYHDSPVLLNKEIVSFQSECSSEENLASIPSNLEQHCYLQLNKAQTDDLLVESVNNISEDCSKSKEKFFPEDENKESVERDNQENCTNEDGNIIDGTTDLKKENNLNQEEKPLVNVDEVNISADQNEQENIETNANDGEQNKTTKDCQNDHLPDETQEIDSERKNSLESMGMDLGIEKSESEKNIQENQSVKSDNQSRSCTPVELGINLDQITVPKMENLEWGFHVYGGQNGGPNGETLPVFVIGVEKNTCNWPVEHDEPYLKNGQNLLELNGTVLSTLTISKIQAIIDETEGDLHFKILTMK